MFSLEFLQVSNHISSICRHTILMNSYQSFGFGWVASMLKNNPINRTSKMEVPIFEGTKILIKIPNALKHAMTI